VQLALRVVEPARAGPAVRAAVDRLGAGAAVHPRQLGGEPVEHVVPRERDVLVRAAALVRAGAVLQPAAADHRRRDAQRMAQGTDEVAQQRRRRRVPRVGAHGHHLAAVVDLGGKGAPVRHVRPRPGHRPIIPALRAAPHRCSRSMAQADGRP
jgi:hypothetical protein